MTLAELSPPADEKVGRPRSIYTSPHIPSFHSDFLSFFLLGFSFTRRGEKKTQLDTQISLSLSIHIFIVSLLLPLCGWQMRVEQQREKLRELVSCFVFRSTDQWKEGYLQAQIHQPLGNASLWLGRILLFFALLFLQALEAFSLAMTQVPPPPSLFLHVLYTQTRIFLYLLRICFLVFFL